MRYFITTFIVLIATILLFGFQANAEAIESGELIKASGPAVYYYFDGKRYVFPNEQIYFSWYENFDDVKTVSDSTLASVQIGGNVTYRPGTKLVKITSDPKVYMVTEANMLQWVQTEADAIKLYGEDWAKQVSDVSDAFFLDYEIGEPLSDASLLNENYKTVAMATYPYYAGVLAYLIKQNETGSLENFVHPDLMTGLEVGKYGYSASTTYSTQELEQFFKDSSNDWTMQTNYMHGYASGTARLMNFSKTMGDSFAHRSVIITDEVDTDYREILFVEILYPKGYLSYPGAVTFDYLQGDYDVQHAYIATVSREEIQSWYSAVGATNGWKELTLESAENEVVLYNKLQNSNLDRSLQLMYLNGTNMPEFSGLVIVGSEYSKILE